MAKDTQADALGRELQPATSSAPQTVTQFAVEQGVLESSDPGVQAAVKAEKERAKVGTERAQQVSQVMAPAAVPEEHDGE